MKNKKWILPVSIVVGVILVLLSITLIAFGGIVSAKGYSVSRGRLYFADNGTYLINGDASMLVNDCSDDARLFEGYQNGDRVILLHGAVDDSFPAITDGYRVFRTLKGDGTYKPEDEMIGVETIIGESEHTHETASDEQTVSNPISGYCGNTQTTIYFADGKSYTFMSGNSVTMTDILVNLKYDKNKLCKCLPEYTVDTEFGTGYGINLTGGYARCDKGQADLTQVQIDKLKEIILWAKEAEAGSTNTAGSFSP